MGAIDNKIKQAWPTSGPATVSSIRELGGVIETEVDKKADKAIELQGSGLVSISNPALSGTNPTIDVARASTSEVAAGTENGKAVTPAALKLQVDRIGGIEGALALAIDRIASFATSLAGKAAASTVAALSSAFEALASTMEALLRLKVDLATWPTRHPADNVLAFASAAVGAPASKPQIPTEWVAVGPDGLPVIALPPRASLASRFGWRVADGARRIDIRLRRTAAVTDPASDGVRIAVQMLDAKRKAIGFPIDLETLLDLTPASGIYERSFVLGPEAGDAIDVPLSPSAAFAVPLIQTYGDTGVEIDVFEHRDVSLLLDLMDRVATLEETV